MFEMKFVLMKSEQMWWIYRGVSRDLIRVMWLVDIGMTSYLTRWSPRNRSLLDDKSPMSHTRRQLCIFFSMNMLVWKRFPCRATSVTLLFYTTYVTVVDVYDYDTLYLICTIARILVE